MGKFIVFEGLDGSGRSTAVESLKNYLLGKRLSVLATKEPTADSEAGREIRRILKEKIETNPIDLQRLFTQDRKEHLEKQIIPALESGKTVVLDRYFFSTLAFGMAHGSKLDELMELNKDFPYPDLVFYFKVTAKTSMKRIERRGNPKEFFEKEEMLERVKRNYDAFAQIAKNFIVIDAERSKEEVFKEIKKYV